MVVEKIKLSNFRNYINEEIHLNPNINLIIGKNAQGKTSLLEAIFLSLNGRSFRVASAEDLITFNLNNSQINSVVKNDVSTKINFCEISHENKVKIYIDGVEQKKKEIPIQAIIFSPKDLEIVQGTPDLRRYFLDETAEIIISNHRYYRINFYKALKQRNYLLRLINHRNKSADSIGVWDEQIVKYGSQIIKNRLKTIDLISEEFSSNYEAISGTGESCEIEYLSKIDLAGEIETSFREKLQHKRDEDIITMSTSIGPHRDDFKIYIGKRDSKSFCSQGEQRSIVLALRLSQMDILRKEGKKPVLLLDDVMSELDSERQKLLLNKIKGIDQTIITSANLGYFKEVPEDSAIYMVENGKCELWKT